MTRCLNTGTATAHSRGRPLPLSRPAALASAIVALALCLGHTGEAAAQNISDLESKVEKYESDLAKLEAKYVNPALLEQKYQIETRINDGRVFYLLKDYSRASIIFLDLVYNKTSKGTPAHKDSLFYLADSLYLKGDRLGARRHFEELLNNNPGSYYEDTVKRLIEIATLDNDYDAVERLYRAAQANGSLSPELTYVYAKSLFFQDRLDDANAIFANIPAGSSVGLASVYFRGTILAKKGADSRDEATLKKAVDTFKRVVEMGAREGGDEEETANTTEMVELAHLSLGRLHYELGEHDLAIGEYQYVRRTSQHFDRALFELTWTYVKLEDLKAAQRSLDILLLADPDSSLAPEARLLRGDLLLRLEEYGDAVATYQQVIDEYEPVKDQLSELVRRDDGPKAYFDALVGRDVGALNKISMPDVVGAWVEEDPKMARTLSVARDLESSRQDIAESVEIINELEDVINSRSRIDIFPELSEGWGRGLEVETGLIDVKLRLLEIERREVVGNGPGSPELQRRHTHRKQLEEAYKDIPKSRADLKKRSAEVRQRFNDLEIQIFRLGYEIDSMRAQLVAMEKWIEDAGKAGDASIADVDAIKSGMLQQEELIIELEKQRVELRRLVRRNRNQTGIRDEIAESERDLKKEYQAAIAAEREALAAMGGGSSTSDINRIFATILRIEAALQSYFSKLEGIVNNKVDNIRNEIDAEKLRITQYATDLDAFTGTSESLAGDIAVSNFRRVEAKFNDIILKADVGIIDVAWMRKEDRSTRIKELFELKSNDLKSLDQVFEDVRTDE